MHMRLSRDDERDAILDIVNAAAQAYRGLIPADRWHEPHPHPTRHDRHAHTQGYSRAH